MLSKVNPASALRHPVACVLLAGSLWLAGTVTAHPQATEPGGAVGVAPATQYVTPQAPARSTIYTVRDTGALREARADGDRVRSMVDRLVVAITGKSSVVEAWRSLVDPRDVVGIKISATGGMAGSTHRAVVIAIVEGLRSAGVPAANILIWDRDAEDLQNAGYLARDGRTSLLVCPVRGIEPRWGYDAASTYTAPYLGKLIWGDLQFKGRAIQADTGLRDATPAQEALASAAAVVNARPGGGEAAQRSTVLAEANLSSASHYCNILSKRVTKIVNVPVYADNYFAGLGGCLYNVTIPNLDNWRRLVGQPRYGVSAIPEIYSDPQVGGKVVLNIVDGLVAQIAGGPSYQP